MSGPRCIGCGRTCAMRVFVASGRGAESLGAPDGLEVEMGRRPICDDCLAKSDREAAWLRVQRDRLVRRGLGRVDVERIMCRRVDRFFRDGTFAPLGKAAVA